MDSVTDSKLPELLLHLINICAFKLNCLCTMHTASINILTHACCCRSRHRVTQTLVHCDGQTAIIGRLGNISSRQTAQSDALLWNATFLRTYVLVKDRLCGIAAAVRATAVVQPRTAQELSGVCCKLNATPARVSNRKRSVSELYCC